MRGEKVPPEPREMVTMYVSDVVGFTDISAALPHEKVRDMLDRLYSRLDAAAEACGAAKVETIGDAYLCVTNLAGDQASDHAARMARFALAALRAAAATLVDEEDPGRGGLRLRVGLHSGPCTAGVVGRQCPKFTLFGEAVAVASRMEASGAPGRVHCSARAAALLRAQDPAAAVEPRGGVDVKGLGAVETFWLTDPRAEAEAAAGAEGRGGGGEIEDGGGG
jgi:class 3 adenylate cyclase